MARDVATSVTVGVPKQKPNEEGKVSHLRILILNWRCPYNPSSGGAEILTFEMAKLLRRSGHQIEWFSSMYPGALQNQEVEGIRFVRAGGQATVHWNAFCRYRRRARLEFDAVIDEVNTIPFFTPLWAHIPTAMLIFQLARDVWWYESPFPLNLIGYLLEPLYLRLYSRVPAITISESTKRDLMNLNFKKQVRIVPIGVRVPSSRAPKSRFTTFAYVGRLAPSKRVGDILIAFANFLDAGGEGVLWLIGDGNATHVRRLVRAARTLGIQQKTKFWGRVTTDLKEDLVSQAHVLLMASVREGWGLVVTEANSLGTPAIVYDVPGLRDSVRNEQTGLIVAPSPKALAAGMARLVSDSALYERLAREAALWSSSLTFDRAAAGLAEALEGVVAA